MPERWCALIAALSVALGAMTVWGAEGEVADLEAEVPPETELVPPTIRGDKLTIEGELFQYVGVTQQVHFAHNETSITADRMIWYRDRRLLEAEGNVVLRRGTDLFITCVRLRYDVDSGLGMAAFTMSAADPWYAWGKKIYRISDDEYRVHNGYMTTDDYLRPNWRIKARTIVIYPGVKVVAYRAIVYAGRVPILYMPKYVRRLDDKRAVLTARAGRTHDWGAFILTSFNFMIKKAPASIHVDYRAKQRWATGFDITIPTANGGEGDLTTYYADDRSGQRDEDTRWRMSYKHYQPIGERWDAWLELHKFSDVDMLEDFFRRDFRDEIQPRSFLHLQRYDPGYMINFDLHKQLNDFYDVVERLPEVSLEVPLQRIGRSPFYYEGATSLAALERHYPEGATRVANPAAPVRRQRVVPLKDYDSVRFDTFNEFSYPRKYFGWLTIVPRLGLRGTYYSKGQKKETDLWRSILSTELEFFTKLFRIWEVENERHNIYGLRHVVEPSVHYFYTPEPTREPSELFKFDYIDKLDEENRFRLGVRNKLQTKRYESVWDLVDFDTYIDYFPEGEPKKKPRTPPARRAQNDEADFWGNVHHDIEIRPHRSFWIDIELAWDVAGASLEEIDTAVTVFHEDIWLLSLEHLDRLRRRTESGLDDDDEDTVKRESNLLALQGYVKLSELWWLEAYARYEFETAELEEGEIALSYDLRTWVMTMAYRSLDQENQFWVMFHLKAYPESGIRSSE